MLQKKLLKLYYHYKKCFKNIANIFYAIMLLKYSFFYHLWGINKAICFL